MGKVLGVGRIRSRTTDRHSPTLEVGIPTRSMLQSQHWPFAAAHARFVTRCAGCPCDVACASQKTQVTDIETTDNYLLRYGKSLSKVLSKLAVEVRLD